MADGPTYASSTVTRSAASSSESTLSSTSSTGDKSPRPACRRHLVLFLAALGVAGASIFFVFHKSQARALDLTQAGTAVAQRKDFVSMLRLSGTTEALRSRPVLAPRLAGAQLDSMVVTKILPAGAPVLKGELLVEFDRQAQIKDALDKKAAYEDLVDQVIQKRAAEDAARAKDEDDLRQAQDALDKAQLEMGKNEILSRIDAEKNREALTEAQQTLKQLQNTFKLKRQAADADIKTLEIQRDRAKATMVYAQSNAEKMSIVSPMDGVVVLNNVWLGSRIGQVQEGNEVRPGEAFMKVIDPSAMDVRVEVNQEDLLKLHLGQHAKISLDAYPQLSFPGTLEELDPLGHPNDQSDTIRTFAAVFNIQGSNAKLMPDLSAAVDLELADIKNALVIPAQGLEQEENGDYVWLKTGNAFEKHAVTAGPSDGMQSVIEEGLKPDDIIRIAPQPEQGPS